MGITKSRKRSARTDVRHDGSKAPEVRLKRRRPDFLESFFQEFELACFLVELDKTFFR
jgi:hypothetical protein